MTNLNCIIVDDIKVDRLAMQLFVKSFTDFNIVGIFDTTEEARNAVLNHKIDIAFLDVQMPDENGFDFRESFLDIPVCVFFTAYPDFALESYELNALDFLIKPIDDDRFKSTVRRINDYFDIRNKALLFDENNVVDDTFMIKEGYDQTKIKLHDIIYLEALKDYTVIVTPQKRHYVLLNIGSILKQPFFNSFIRIHRSYAVQKQFVNRIGKQEITLNNEVFIPVGRSYKDNLKLLE